VIYYPILFPWYLISLIFFFRIKDYDRLIVVNGGYPASLLCRAAIIAWWLRGNRTKGVFNFHNSTTTIKWYLRVPEFVIDYLVRISSSYIVSVSLNCLNSLSLRPAFNGYNMFVCIYNGIEDPIGLLNAREKYRDKVERYCLMLATYEIRKGHEFILEAFEILVKENRDKIKLVICGHGSKSEKDRVRKKIEELDLGNYVILRDFTPVTTDLIFYSDLLVIPSQANESFGLTAIEAMSLYTPVIATDVGGLPEVLGGCDSGFICSRTDPKEFANAMNRVLQNKSKAIQLGQNGRLCFERRYSASLMAEQYYKLINFK
jgi:glycosyltransferase involved in cell wall biosynthesis